MSCPSSAKTTATKSLEELKTKYFNDLRKSVAEKDKKIAEARLAEKDAIAVAEKIRDEAIAEAEGIYAEAKIAAERETAKTVEEATRIYVEEMEPPDYIVRMGNEATPLQRREGPSEVAAMSTAPRSVTRSVSQDEWLSVGRQCTAFVATCGVETSQGHFPSFMLTPFPSAGGKVTIRTPEHWYPDFLHYTLQGGTSEIQSQMQRVVDDFKHFYNWGIVYQGIKKNVWKQSEAQAVEEEIEYTSQAFAENTDTLMEARKRAAAKMKVSAKTKRAAKKTSAEAQKSNTRGRGR